LPWWVCQDTPRQPRITAFDELPGGLDALLLIREPVLMAVPASHPLARHRPVALQKFREETFIFFQPGTGLGAITERATRRAALSPRAGFESANWDRLLALVGAGLGVALVPASAVRDSQQPGVAALPVSPTIERTVGAVWRADRRHTPAASGFLALLREQAERAGSAVTPSFSG
jgi:DNA-binding transcriptional LysR family regulator